MGQRFLIDTNVIIDYTSGLLPNSGSTFVESILNTDFNISIITKIESLGFDGDHAKMQMLEEFIATANIFQLDDAVAQKTIDLRKRRKMKLGDAIIMATVDVHKLSLITRNIADFSFLDKSRLIDPWQK